MTLTIIGHGYVGLVTACVFADLGNTVHVIGRNEQKIKKLNSGDPLIYEPGLEELLKKNLSQKRISFSMSYKNNIVNSDVVFIAVGTPSKNNGEADLTSVFDVAKKVAKNLKKGYTLISCKSTVPVGTNRIVKKIIFENAKMGCLIDIASCPEFLREGSAISDTFIPDRIVIGTDSPKAINLLLKLHKPLNGERVIVGLESAELIKYASNSILATKISFTNLMSFICEKTSADVLEVMKGVGLDKRIGTQFLQAGIGYGGSCFPKDVNALIKTGQNLNIDMAILKAVDQINLETKNNFLKKIFQNCPIGKIAIWGLSFKPNTDDIRDAASLYIIDNLLYKNYQLVVYDPEAHLKIKSIYGKKIVYAKDPMEAIKNADCLLILTEWNQFKQIDLRKIKLNLKKPVIIDGRNIYDPSMMKKLGFKYISVGR